MKKGGTMPPLFISRAALDYLKAQPLLMPNLRNTLAAGQKPVIEDWIRFTPMKTVNHMNSGDTKAVSTTLSRTINPANIITLRSRVISIILGQGNPTVGPR